MNVQRSADLARAEREMLDRLQRNTWFAETFWPEGRGRMLAIAADLLERLPPSSRILDIGCFNGFFMILLRALGFRVLGIDTPEWVAAHGAELGEQGLEAHGANLNDPEALRWLADASVDAVVMGEVIEHVLDHPLGVMREVGRVTRTGGVVVVTTPNPATIANAWRVLAGRATLWGTHEFVSEPKIQKDRRISCSTIHFREYLASELRTLVEDAGLTVERMSYLSAGSAPSQPVLKRLVKASPLAQLLTSTRLFGSTHYVVARKTR